MNQTKRWTSIPMVLDNWCGASTDTW